MDIGKVDRKIQKKKPSEIQLTPPNSVPSFQNSLDFSFLYSEEVVNGLHQNENGFFFSFFIEINKINK